MNTRLAWKELVADDTTETHEFNWARHFSAINRKALDQVDAKGNALVYRVAIKQSASGHDQSDITTVINTASNNYVTARAVKAWHRARMKMLKREGISMKQLGKYDRTLKFPLTTSDSYENALNAGSWDNTTFAVESPLDGDATTALQAVHVIDGYTLTLTGASVAESSAAGEQKYTTVGINDSWLAARRNPTGTSGSDEPAIDHESNPLYNIISGSVASEEVLEIVQASQNADPPYSSSTFNGLFFAGKLYSSQHQVDRIVVDCPAGLMQAKVTNGATGGDSYVEWDVELIDVFPMK